VPEVQQPVLEPPEVQIQGGVRVKDDMWRVAVSTVPGGSLLVREAFGSEAEAEAFTVRFVADMARVPVGTVRIAVEHLETEGWATVRAKLAAGGPE